MYLSTRAQQLRNALVAITNGSITLIILLIAPLGLAAVIINTLLVTASSYVISSIADKLIVWLLPNSQAELRSDPHQNSTGLRHISRQSFLKENKRN
ncbi:MAG: CRISPR-associated protein Csx18 [Phormidium sp.]